MESNTWYLEEDGNLDYCYRVPGKALTEEEKRDASFLIGEVRQQGSRLSRNAAYRLTATLPSGKHIIARGQRIITTGKPYHVLREIPDKIPDLQDRDWRFPTHVRRLLLNPGLRRGGLIVLSGAGGSGKSTTVAATVTSRLRTFGGIAYTVEYPPEYAINGQHGKAGVCFQFDVDDESEFRSRIHDALRGYPAGVEGSILMIGEIRNAEVASLALESALSGHLVITTIHGMSIELGLARLESLASQLQGTQTARRDLATTFRIGIHQRLTRQPDGVRMQARVLYSSGADSVAAKLRNGNYPSLAEEIERLHNQRKHQQKRQARPGARGSMAP